MAAESDESPAGRAVLIFFAVLVLYILSIGPAALYFPWEEFEYPTPENVYLPLFWAADHCLPVSEALRWYLALWGVEGG